MKRLAIVVVGLALLLMGCGGSAPPAPDTSKALPFAVIKEGSGPLGSTGYTITERYVLVAPGKGNHEAYAHTAIKAALDGVDRFESDTCRVYVLDSPALVGAGMHLARAVYTPQGKGPDGSDAKVWAVEALRFGIEKPYSEMAATYIDFRKMGLPDGQAVYEASRKLMTTPGTISEALRRYLARKDYAI